MKTVVGYLRSVLSLAGHLRPLEKILVVVVGSVAFTFGFWLGEPSVQHVIWTQHR